MRTRIIPKMLNSEVQDYLKHNDIVIVPVGTIEMHGGLPMDCETVLPEAIALKMAEACDGLVLTGLPYFYAGATAAGRGTVQVSVREGIDYLMAIARSLLRQGFKRQLYVSAHGPAALTISAVARDFFDETGVSILYVDSSNAMMKIADFTKPGAMAKLNTLFIGGYKVMGCLEDVPLVTEFEHSDPQTCSHIKVVKGSGSVGYYFMDEKDHGSTPAIPDEATREAMAATGVELIEQMVEALDVPSLVDSLRDLEAYNAKVMEDRPWTPAAFNNR